MTRIFFTAAGLAAALFSWTSEACAMGRTPPRESKPVPAAVQPVPSRTLQECFELALRRSETVAISHEEIEQAKASFYTAAGEALGDVSFVMNHTRAEHQRGRGEGGVGGTFTSSSRRDRMFTISQPLFQGFRSLGAITGAGSLKGQRAGEKQRAIELLFLDVTDTFYSLLTHYRDVQTILEIQKLYRERVGDLKKREKIGRSRASEVASARARMKTLEAELAQSRGEMTVTEYILEFLTGVEIEPESLVEPELSQDETELAILLEAVDYRADVSASYDAMKTAKRKIIIAQSGLWPSIDLESNQYERRDGFQSGIDWDMLIKVEVPLFRGGENIGAIKQAVSEYRQAKLTYERTRREAELEIKESFANWNTAMERDGSLQQAVKAADENFQFQKEEYSRNLVSNLDVLEALQILLETRQDANQAHYELRENYWRVQVARGSCCEFGMPASENDPSSAETVPAAGITV